MSLEYNTFLEKLKGIEASQGSVNAAQIEFLRKFLTEQSSIQTILEVGFNVGLSSATMMDVRSTIQITGFDILWWQSSAVGKVLIDAYYPNRHILIAGDTTFTLPAFFKRNPTYQPDFVFLDGGHKEPLPRLDLYAILKHVKPGTWILIDDYCETYGREGVISAVNYFLQSNVLIDAQIYTDQDRGWILAKRSASDIPDMPIDQILKERLKQICI